MGEIILISFAWKGVVEKVAFNIKPWETQSLLALIFTQLRNWDVKTHQRNPNFTPFLKRCCSSVNILELISCER